MIDLDAARTLKYLTPTTPPALAALLDSIEKEYGPLAPLTLDEASAEETSDELRIIAKYHAEGHTEPCAAGLVWGDRICVCQKPPQTIAEWQAAIYQYSKDKGWWEEPRHFGDICSLFHTEISEAFEEYRAGHDTTEVYENSEKPGKLEGIPVELADLVIRVLDFCGGTGINLQDILTKKHAYNLTRAYRHGGKRV